MSDVAAFLGAAVNVSVNKLARDHPALARRLNWSVDEVKKNTAHAIELARRDLSRQAVVEHVTQSLRPRTASTAPTKQPNLLERGAAALRQEVDRQVHAVTHPTEALANYIHDKRILHTERHLARAGDILGGSVAGLAADTIEGVGKIADLNHRYLQGGLIEEALAKRGLIPPPVKAADQAAKWAAPLRREAELRPPTTKAGKALAAVPKIVSVALAPELIGTALLATQGVGAASHRARQTGSPDNLRTDLAIGATGAIDALAGRLLKTGRIPDPFRFIERQPAAVRGKLQDLVIKTLAKSAGGAVVSTGQTALDNAVAKASYDPDRRLQEGVGESAVFGGVLGPLGSMAGKARTVGKQPSRAPFPGNPEPYDVFFEHSLTGSTRSWHRTQANNALHSRLSSDEEFARTMNESLGADVRSHMNSGKTNALRNPPEMEWHHPTQKPDVVQLLRKSDHRHPELQHILHPNGKGAYALRSAAPASPSSIPSDRNESGD